MFINTGCGSNEVIQSYHEISVLDITPSHTKDLRASDIIRHLHLPDVTSVSPHSYRIKFSNINDKHQQLYFVENLDSAASYNDRIEKVRIAEQQAFVDKISRGFDQIPKPSKDGLSESFVFQSLKTHLNELGRSNADVRTLRAWTDLLENTEALRVYAYKDKPRVLFENGADDQIIQQLDDYFDEEGYEDWSGINVIVYYYPDKSLDGLYSACRRIFRKWVESHGASIQFEVMT